MQGRYKCDRPWNLSCVKREERTNGWEVTEQINWRIPWDQSCWTWHGKNARSKQGPNGRWLESRMLKTEIPEVVIGNGRVLGLTKQWVAEKE